MLQKWPIRLSFILIILVTLWVPHAQAEQELPAKGRQAGGDGPSSLVINPRDVDLGMIGPGETAEGVFYLTNASADPVTWFTEGVEGWTQTEPIGLAGSVANEPFPLKISITSQDKNLPGRLKTASLLLQLEWGETKAVFLRQAPLGILREAIRFNVPGGTRLAFFQARLTDLTSRPLLNVAPLQIDYGAVRSGEQVARRVQLTNRGRESLTWKAALAGGKAMQSASPLPVGRYVSYRNESLAGAGTYLPPASLRGALEFSGPWGEEWGHPATEGEQRSLRYRFAGTGISLFVWKTPGGGPFTVLFDEQVVDFFDGHSERRERVEIPIVAGQLEGSHVLTVVSGGGRLIIEGVRVFGKPIQKGPPGWISFFPDSGTTTRETDYINITLNTRHLVPGLYGGRLLVASSGGDADVELFLEVAEETQARFLDVHRYVAGSDYLYTTDPQGEQKRLQAKGYRHLGVAFRLFSPGTPGTTEFFRWFHPGRGDHFYSNDSTGGGKPLAGYLYEGSIGNIATSRLNGTRPLYRWHNPVRGLHFYTTDEVGEGMGKKGYRFDGIAGFVR
jgi:hypothetical protein